VVRLDVGQEQVVRLDVEDKEYIRFEDGDEMRLLYCDETNLEPRDGDFFVYGGLSISESSALMLSERIDAIRLDAKVPNDFRLKFNPGPEGMSHHDFIELKQNVILASIEAGCEMYVSIILHNIASDVSEARRNEINRVCLNFNSLLNRDQEVGLVLVDRFEDQKIDGHLREKFSIGLKGMPYSESFRLNRIVGFHYSAIGQSNFPSIVDIVIGSLRFCINEHTRHRENPSASCNTILKLLSPLFPRNSAGRIDDQHMFFSPKVIKSARFKGEYEALCEFFASFGLCPNQRITDQREY
jgi:hypothetical protein